MTPNQTKYRERQRVIKQEKRRKKEAAKLAEAIRYRDCCRDNLIEWGCYCYNGCEACSLTHECKTCNTRYNEDKIKELVRLELPVD